MESKKVHSGPVKDFFVDTITKDVSIGDCILDLLDNCLDGAGRVIVSENKTYNGEHNTYNGFYSKISFKDDCFSIEDNCGGIPLDYAIDYAFHFGRRPDAPKDSDGLIGLYGIGMKRAIFKIGRKIEIATSTKDISYKVPIDVLKWLRDKEWDFDIEPSDKSETLGTKILITELRPQIRDELALETFESWLARIIARDYSFFLQKGFQVIVNDNSVTPFKFTLLESDQFSPHLYKI